MKKITLVLAAMLISAGAIAAEPVKAEAKPAVHKHVKKHKAAKAAKEQKIVPWKQPDSVKVDP